MIKILVVDDEDGVCDSIKQIFTYVGFSVFTATNAKKALNLLERERPKIVFLDILMPDVDGLELLKKIKQIDPGTIVIMVTARQDEEARVQSLEAGADEFVRKPFSRNYLRDTVVAKIKDVLDRGGHMQVPCILIVDDEDEAREHLKEFLSMRYECRIELAGDGVEAIAKTKETKPDVILLDIKMPGMSGMDALAEMKKIHPGCRIIVVSAWKSAEVVKQAITKGAVDYMGKPISLAALADKLQTVLVSIGKLVVKPVT